MDILINILSTIASYGAELIGLKKNKTNQKRIKYYRTILFIAIGVLIIYAVLTFFSARKMREESFTQKLNEAEYELNCENYEAAVKLCSEAQNLAYNEGTQLAADYFKGYTFFYKGLSLQDTDAYHSALKQYREIINNCSETDNYFYFRAVTDSCYIYYWLEYPYTDPYWTELIYWLNDFDSEGFNKMEDLGLFAGTNLTLSCALYAERATEALMDTDEGIFYLEWAARSYDSTLQLLSIANENSGINMFDDPFTLSIVTQSCSKAIEYYRAYYGYSGIANVSDIERIVALCESALSYSYNKPIAADYIALNAAIGECYWFLEYLESNSDIALEYAKEAYQVLMPLVRLQLNPEYTDFLDFPISIFVVGSKLCTEDDINDILALYDKGLAKYNPTAYLTERLEVLQLACDFCIYYYALDCSELPQIRAFATATIEELESMWSSHLTDSDRDTIQELKSLLN